MHHEIALFVMPTHTGTEALAFILRWIHLLAGITWVGLLYFFNLVNVPVQKTLDADTKKKVNPDLLGRALWYFRWGAVVTGAPGSGGRGPSARRRPARCTRRPAARLRCPTSRARAR